MASRPGRVIAPLGLCASLAALGCPAEEPDTTVVRFEPTDAEARPLVAIERDDVVRAFARARLERDHSVEATALTPDLRRRVIDDLVESRLLRAEAQARGLTVTSSVVDRELEAMKRAMPEDQFREQLIDTYQTESLLRQRIEERLLAGKLLGMLELRPVRDADVKSAWESLSTEEKTLPVRLRAAQIFVPTESIGRAVLERLDKGETFEELARAFEPDTAGDLGWFSRGEMPPVIEEACFELEPGERSGLIPSEYGHHIFKVYEREPQRVRTFEETYDELKQRLVDERMRQAQADLLARMKNAYRIVWNEPLRDQLIEEGP